MNDYFVKLARYALNPGVPGEQRGQAFRDVMDAVVFVVRKTLAPHFGDKEVTLITRDTLLPRSHLYVEMVARLDCDRNIPNTVMEALARHAQIAPFSSRRVAAPLRNAPR